MGGVNILEVKNLKVCFSAPGGIVKVVEIVPDPGKVVAHGPELARGIVEFADQVLRHGVFFGRGGGSRRRNIRGSFNIRGAQFVQIREVGGADGRG